MIDLIVLGILALCVVVGVYRGFLRSALSFASFILALVIVLIALGPAVRWTRANTSIFSQIEVFTEAGEILSDPDTGQREAGSFTAEELERVLEGTSLPKPIVNSICKNVLAQNKTGEDAVSLEDYINHTIADLVINVAVFIVLYLLVIILLQIVLGLVGAMMKLPVLRQLDGLLGGIGGLLVGLLVVMILFCAVPVIQSALRV